MDSKRAKGAGPEGEKSRPVMVGGIESKVKESKPPNNAATSKRERTKKSLCKKIYVEEGRSKSYNWARSTAHKSPNGKQRRGVTPLIGGERRAGKNDEYYQQHCS